MKELGQEKDKFVKDENSSISSNDSNADLRLPADSDEKSSEVPESNPGTQNGSGDEILDTGVNGLKVETDPWTWVYGFQSDIHGFHHDPFFEAPSKDAVVNVELTGFVKPGILVETEYKE